MKKNFKSYIVIWAIALAIFNVIAFLIPSDDKFTTNFIIGYLFITIAFLLQLGVGFFAFKDGNSSKAFLGIPTATLSMITLVGTTIVAVVTMAIEDIPDWLGAIICFVVFALGSIGILLSNSVANTVAATDYKVKTQTFYIKALTVDVNTLMAQSPTAEIRAEVAKVYEAVRYSDPMSNQALAPSEAQMTIKFNQFSNAVLSNDYQSVQVLANDMLILIQDRNNKCKLLK
jgi:hypothetical protein